MRNKIIMKLAIVTLTMTLTACTAPYKKENTAQSIINTNAIEANLTIGQLADYFINAADDYQKNVGIIPDLATILDGFAEFEKATRLQMFVIASRAFGELPIPNGIAKKIAPPLVDLTGVPEWANKELQNLSNGGILSASDLGLNEKTSVTHKVENTIAFTDSVDEQNTFEKNNVNTMDSSVTLKDAEILAARFFAMFGTNLKDDFYTAVNKNELDTLEIPEGSSATGGSSTVIANTDKKLHDLIIEIVDSDKEYHHNSPEQKIQALYNNVLNVEARNQAGIEPLQKYLDAADSANNFSELFNAIAQAVNELGNLGNGIFPMIAVTDTKDSTRHVMQLMTMSPMFDANEYDEASDESFKDYRESMFKQLLAVGETEEDAKKHLKGILKMEQKLAMNITDIEEMSNLQNERKYYTPEKLDEMMPQAKPSELFSAIGLQPNTLMQVFDDKQFEVYTTLFTEENLELFKSMQKIALLTGFSQFLSTELAENYSYQTSSIQDIANSAVQTFLSEELGQLYVNRYFSAESKSEIEKMVAMMIDVYKKRIVNLDWMEESTKKEALKKLDSITVLIGYPNEWQLNNAEIKNSADGGNYFENAAASEVDKWKKMVEKMDTPVDPHRFALAAFTVNAAASRNTNTIIFPAGILQAPLYDKNASFETNLGSIGSTIAHEISHMFDNEGAQYDAEGNVRNWWTDSDYEHFKTLCQKVENFYEGREAAPAISPNSKETLSENIADIGGIACGLDILSEIEDANYDAFFRSYARYWLKVTNYDTLKELAESDFHAPNNLRCNLVLSNFQEFFDTYDIKAGDGMYVSPENRIKIW